MNIGQKVSVEMDQNNTTCYFSNIRLYQKGKMVAGMLGNRPALELVLPIYPHFCLLSKCTKALGD